MMPYYNTIDLDKVDKNQLQVIIFKIKMQSCCLGLKYKDSSSKGYHILLTCKTQGCDKCRLVFDDQKRLEMDSNREEKFRNTLFTDKEFVRGNLKTINLICERCLKYGNHQTLSKRTLESVAETKKKLHDGKITLWNPAIVYLTYNYFECPICHWFKFVQI